MNARIKAKMKAIRVVTRSRPVPASLRVDWSRFSDEWIKEQMAEYMADPVRREEFETVMNNLAKL